MKFFNRIDIYNRRIFILYIYYIYIIFIIEKIFIYSTKFNKEFYFIRNLIRYFFYLTM